MRQLASIQTIKYLRPIEGADRIEAAGILGWEVVVNKGEFQVNDKCVFFEIDCWLPHEIAPFLSKNREPREYNGVKGERLKTARLRGVLSQGLALPLNHFPKLENCEVGDDVTSLLNIQKYEPPIPAAIQGDARSFSWPVSKTDEERVQSDDKYNFIRDLTGHPYYISLKLDGTSCTFLINEEGEYHVCGRNYSYKENDNHAFWQVSKRYDIEGTLRKYREKGIHLAIQGECAGPGIQGNKLGLKEVDVFIFNVVDIRTGIRYHLDTAKYTIESVFGMKFVPIIEEGNSFRYSVEDCLRLAEGKYIEHFPNAHPSQHREGVVIRSFDGRISFKAISNKFLLKEVE